MALTRFTIRQLEAFVAVADRGGFAAAGEQLGLTSSAISQLVGEMESSFGLRLFDRSTRRVTLSEPGRGFLGAAKAVIRHIRLAETTAADLCSQTAGAVRIGASPVIASLMLPATVHAFKQTCPEATIHIRDFRVEMPIQSIASGEVDLALGVDVASAPAVDREEIFRTPWVLWCAPSHPIAKKDVLRWNDLHDLDFVEAGTNPEASILEMRNFAPQHHPSAGFQWVSHFSTALGIAAQGLAVTTGPAYADVMARLYGLKMLRITEPEVVRQVCLYRPAKTVMSSNAEAFRSFAIAYIRKWTLDERTIPPLDD